MATIEQEMIIIRDCLATWITQVRLANAVNYYDINRLSEGSAMHLLNLVRGYTLKDLNREQNNFPGIDLGDRTAGIGVQVTSRTDTAKLMHTLQLFSGEGYAVNFPNGVHFLIINDGKRWRIAPEKLEAYRDIFDPKKNIWFITDLINDIQALYYQQPELFSSVKAFLQKEFRAIDYKTSIVSPATAANQLKLFRVLYQAAHEQAAKLFIDFKCKLSEVVLTTEQLSLEINETALTVIAGPSGFGKTLLAKRLTLDMLGKGLPIFIRAKYYENGLESLMNKEALVYGFATAAEWLAVAKTTGLTPWLVIDGLNECPGDWRPKLLTEMEQLISQHDTHVIVTVQVVSEQLNALNPGVVTISTPEEQTKQAIAALYSGKPMNKKFETMLNVITSNIEAQMVGEIGAEDIDQVSRFRVFELFVRRKLSGLHADGLRLLSGIAAMLSQKILFHLLDVQWMKLCASITLNQKCLIAAFRQDYWKAGWGCSASVTKCS